MIGTKFVRPEIFYVRLADGPFNEKSVPFTPSEYDEGPPLFLEIVHNAKIAITLDGRGTPVVEGHPANAYCLYRLYERAETDQRIGREKDYRYVYVSVSLRMTESAIQKVSALLRDK